MKTETKSQTNEIIEGDLIDLKVELSDELKKILEFWSTETIDAENGGFIGEIDFFGNLMHTASKGCVLNTRILWTFSAAYRTTKNPNYKKIADSAYNYIISHFWDSKKGGLYWEVDFLGNPINTRKQAYAQGFGIYAFSEYFRVTESSESLAYAIELFNILETKFWDNTNAGYIEALSEDWNELEDMRLSEKDLNVPKSMNTHLHILEPYANLYRVWQNDKLKESISGLIEIFSEKIFDKETKHLNLFFEKDWSVKSTEISFGHDIEAAWLINEAFMVIHNNMLDVKIEKITSTLVEYTLKEGTDIDGSIFNDRIGNHYDKDKHWWPQAEAMVGYMDAYQINSNPIYVEQVFKIWNFIKYNLIDTKKGEWFWRVDENSIPNESDVKVGFWKCPYHNSRALMELIERINNLNHVK